MKDFSIQLCLIRYIRQNPKTIKLRKNNKFTFVENTISNSQSLAWAKLLESDRLFSFNKIRKFGSFQYPLAMTFSMPKFRFNHKTFATLVKMKEVISMSYDSSTSSWSLRFEIYTSKQPEPTQKFGSSSRSIEFKDIVPWNIS